MYFTQLSSTEAVFKHQFNPAFTAIAPTVDNISELSSSMASFHATQIITIALGNKSISSCKHVSTTKRVSMWAIVMI